MTAHLNSSAYNSNPSAIASVAAKNASLKNFSLNPSEHTYDPEFLLSLLGLQRSSGTPADDNLLQEFPEIFSVSAFPLYAELPLTDEEQKAITLQSFNSHKRMSMDRVKTTNSSAASNSISSSSHHHSGINSNRQHSGGHAGSLSGSFVSTSKRNTHISQGGLSKGFRDDIRSGSSLGGPLSSKAVERGESSFSHGHHQSGGHGPRTADDIWCDPSQSQVGSFDEHGVFRSTAPISDEKSSFTPAKEFSYTSSKPIFERLRENQSAAAQQHPESHPLHHSVGGEHPAGSFSVSANPIHAQPHSLLPNSPPVAPRAPSVDAQSDNRWLYRDPSGNIQGPFNPKEMFDWFQLGYFPPTLPVKRVRDPGFEPLGQIIQRLGALPFSPAVQPPINVFHHPAQQQPQPHPQMPSVATAAANSKFICGGVEEGFLSTLPSHPTKPIQNVSGLHSTWNTNSLSASETMAPVSSSIELPKIDLNSIFTGTSQAPHADRGISSNVAASTAPSKSSVVDTKTLENMLLKELNITKQQPAPEQPSVTSAPKITWNNSKIAPSSDIPSLDQIQQEETTKKKLDDHAPSSSAAVNSKSSPIASLNSGGSTWNVPCRNSVSVKSLEQIEKEEALTSESLKTKSSPHAVGPIFKPLSEIIQTQSTSSKGPISFKSLIENNANNAGGSHLPAGPTSANPKSMPLGGSQQAEVSSSSSKKPNLHSPPSSNASNSAKTSSNSYSHTSSNNSQSQSFRPPAELVDWCRKELKGFEGIDVSTFVSLLLDLSSAKEMKLYIEDVIGHSGKGAVFASEFVKKAKSYVDGLTTEDDEYVVVTKKKTKKSN